MNFSEETTALIGLLLESRRLRLAAWLKSLSINPAAHRLVESRETGEFFVVPIGAPMPPLARARKIYPCIWLGSFGLGF